MRDFEENKNLMLEKHLKNRGIKDKRILQAFEKVPREYFVPESLQNEAYADYPLPIGEGQTISQPYIVALMLELLDINPTDKILEVGTGSGYQTSLLAILGKEVYTVERIKSLYELSRKNIDKMKLKNIRFRLGDGSLGWKEAAPFDKIIVSAATPAIPQPLLEQLSVNGKMVIPVGSKHSQILTIVKKTEKGYTYIQKDNCIFVPLIGQEGWQEQ